MRLLAGSTGASGWPGSGRGSKEAEMDLGSIHWLVTGNTAKVLPKKTPAFVVVKFADGSEKKMPVVRAHLGKELIFTGEGD